MLKFKISADRFTDACSALEYMSVIGGNKRIAMQIVSRFLLDKDGEYIVKAVLDEDGDIASFDGIADATLKMSALTPKRLESLATEVMEAAKAIVNPPKGGDLSEPSSTDTKKPPPG